MFLNSKTLRCDVSQIQTCEVCMEKPIFFTDKDLFRHIQKCHSKKRTGQVTVAAQGLQELEKSKERLAKQLENVKIEYRRLYKSGLVKKETVEIVQKEISSLRRKISEHNEEIKKIKLTLKKEEEDEEEESILDHPQKVMAAFKQKMDREYACLLESLTSKVSVPTLLSDDEDGSTESLRSEDVSNSAFRRLTRERLSKLEVEVKQMKSSQKEKMKETNGQSFEVTKKCLILEHKMKSKTKELEACHESVENMKAVLQDKEKEVTLIHELCENYKNNTQAHSTTKASLEESFSITNQVKEELEQKNAELTQDLHKAASSLKKAESFINKLTEEQNRAEKEKQQNDFRIQELLIQIEDAKKKAVTVEENDKSKIKILQQQLNNVDAELQSKAKLAAAQEDKLAMIETSLNEDVKLLTTEKEELLGIICEMKKGKTANDENKTELVNLKRQHDLLIVKNEEIIVQLETANKLKTQVEEILDEQNNKIEVLQDERATKDKQLKQVMLERDGLQRKLSDIEREHERCRKNEKEMKISYEQSIQTMRMQMEQLMNEETATSVYLEKQLKEKEKLFQEERSNMELEIASREGQIDTLNGDLKYARDQQRCCQEQIDRLKAEIGRLQNEIKNYTQLEEKRSDGLQEVLHESENDKKQLVAEFEGDKNELKNQISNLESQLSKEKASVKTANERVLEIESTLVEVEEQHNYFLQKVKESFEIEQIDIQEKKNKEIEERLKCLNATNQKELDTLKQEYDEEINSLKNRIKTMQEKSQTQMEQFEKIKVGQELMVKELKEKYVEDATKERSEYETQLVEEKLLNQKSIDELNRKIKELEVNGGDQINKAKEENERIKFELLQQKELEKSSQEEIERLKEKLDNQVNNGDLELDLKASQSKVVELSNALHQTKQQYNDSIVDNDEACRRLSSYKNDLNESERQVEDLKLKLQEAERSSSKEQQQKSDLENELDKTKIALAKHVLDIENLHKGQRQLENELEELKQSSENFKTNENKLNDELKGQISDNKELTEKLSRAGEELTKLKEKIQQQKSPNKELAREANKDENEAVYSSSFDGASSSTTKSISFKTPSFKTDESNTHSKEVLKTE